MARVEKIKNILREQKPILRKKFKVRTIGIFGSYLRGKETHKSDVDLLVEFWEPVSLLEFIRTENYLSEIIGIKVDLVMKDALKPRIGEHILREVEVL